MPKAHNLTEFCIVINSVNNAIWTKDEFTDEVILVLRHDATKVWKFLQPICLGNQFVSEGHCAVRIIVYDEEDYIVKIVSCSRRPDYSVSHEASCLFTSS